MSGGYANTRNGLISLQSYSQDALPILNIVVPHVPHVPRVAGLPFFIVTGSAFSISRDSRHFMQYPVMASSLILELGQYNT